MDMRSVAPMKTAKIGYIVMSVLFCVLGVVLLFTPGVSALWIGRLLGIGLILFGAIKLVGYFSRDLFRLAFQYDLAFGLLLMVLGIVTLSHPGDALSFLCVMFGIPVLADGLFKIQIAMDSRQFGIRNWMCGCWSTGIVHNVDALALRHLTLTLTGTAAWRRKIRA